ncbi:YeeE/YedE family protein [Halovulum sp. GXIMD14793]
MTKLRKNLPFLIALAGLLVVALLAWNAAGWRLGLAAMIGGFAGISLYHASFGFTAGWRRLVTEWRSLGVRAQFLLIGLTVLVSFPLIGWGGVGAFVQPVGVGLIVGSFLFGMGMQLGGGCGSGTLFVVGGGSTRMLITLLFFIAGSVIGHASLPFWNAMPRTERGISLIHEFGTLPAMLITYTVIGLLIFIAIRIERSAHGHLEAGRKTTSVLRGHWSPWLGALALVVVSVGTLLVLNRPWGITQAFGYWGAKGLYFMDVPKDSWLLARWSEASLNRTVFASATSVMNFGIILGAMAAAGLAHRWNPVFRLSFTDIWTAVLGGLLMGIGARLSYGCNIGAYLGGVISGSLHGWVWAVFAFAGSSLVAWLRAPRAAPA